MISGLCHKVPPEGFTNGAIFVPVALLVLGHIAPVVRLGKLRWLCFSVFSTPPAFPLGFSHFRPVSIEWDFYRKYANSTRTQTNIIPEEANAAGSTQTNTRTARSCPRPLACLTTCAPHKRAHFTLHPAALASVSSGIALVRVQALSNTTPEGTEAMLRAAG